MFFMQVKQRGIHSWIIWLGLSVLYFALHLPGLTALPIFADEAIYIRWAQLIISDWQQYFFFPLNDGKTPLFIWMLIPLLRMIADPLMAGRLLAVLAGWCQMIVIVHILRTLKVGLAGQIVGALTTIFAPFWFFHHRMVLMDGWLTLWISLTTLSLLKLGVRSAKTNKFLWFAVAVVSVWAGLMTKIPFLLSLPGFLLVPLRHRRVTSALVREYSWILGVLAGGTGLFLLLGFSPVFPQLLTRGGDFLLPIGEVLSGRWRETLPSIPTHLGYFLRYAGWGVMLLAIFGLLLPGKRRTALIFFCSLLLFSLPIWLLGRVVFPRYLFPGMFYLTVLAGLGAGTLWQWSTAAVQTHRRALAIRLLVVILTIQLILTGLQYMVPSWIAPDATPFVSADLGQYLKTWSSGHGLVETMAFLAELRQNTEAGTIRVATEGNFGSLPDGLLLYNFRQPLEGVWIEGIGYPVNAITPEFYSRIQPEDTVLLVVNSDRMLWQLEPEHLLQEYCRPAGGPCLQIWDITDTYPQFKKT